MKAVLIVLLLYLFMLGIWSVDMGMSAVASDGIVMTLFGVRSGADQYHFGLVLSQLCFLLVAILNFIEW